MLKKVASLLLFVVLSATAACAAIFAFGSYKADMGLVRIRLFVEPARQGETNLIIHPFGEISARTHNVPVALNVELDRIRKGAVEGALRNKIEYTEMLDKMERMIPLTLEKFMLKLLFLAGCGGMLGALIGRKIRLYKLALGAAIGVAVFGFIGWGTFSTFDLKQFENPSYRGLTAYAPDLIEAFKNSNIKGKNLAQYFRKMADNVSAFYIEMDQYAEKDSGHRIRLLHISDIHNNPLAGDFVGMLVKGLSPAIILNTGDMTDMGTGLEARLVDSFKDLKPPHFFVAGNHDSPAAIEQMRKSFHTRNLQGEVVISHGLLIMGYGDPKAFKSFDSNDDPKAAEKLTEHIRNRISSMNKPPDILMVHNPDIADALAGMVPLILSGHNHRISVRKIDGTIIVISGTAGAAGIRYIESKKRPDYSAALITAHRSGKRFAFDYVDMIQMNQKTGEFKIERKHFPHEDAAPPPATNKASQ